MKITIDLIKRYKPCQDGIEDFELKYPGYNNTLVHLLSLDDISYDNKIWLVTKVVNIDILKQWSVECAEQVVDNYNEINPGDSRVTDCIVMTKLYLQGKATIDELSAAMFAAKSAAWSARSAMLAARSAESAARSAAWSAAMLAARSAESAARSAARSAGFVAEKQQEDINLSILIALLDNEN